MKIKTFSKKLAGKNSDETIRSSSAILISKTNNTIVEEVFFSKINENSGQITENNGNRSFIEKNLNLNISPEKTKLKKIFLILHFKLYGLFINTTHNFLQ